MGLVRGMSYHEWFNTLTLGDIDAILRAHYENELEHMADIDADAEFEESRDGRV